MCVHICVYEHICTYIHIFLGSAWWSLCFSADQLLVFFQASKKMLSPSSPSTSLQTRWSPSPSRSRSGMTSSVSKTACCSQPWKSCDSSSSSSSILPGSLLCLSCAQPRFVERTAWWTPTALSSHRRLSSPSWSNSEFQPEFHLNWKHLNTRYIFLLELQRMHYPSLDSGWRYKQGGYSLSEKNKDEIKIKSNVRIRKMQVVGLRLLSLKS